MSTLDTNADKSYEPRALVLHARDNVAVVLDEAEPGPITLIGMAGTKTVDAGESIAVGHKVALRAIGTGDPVVKYGVSIGVATEAIAAGGWVHTHNCRSRLDERSHTLDRHTGAPTDTKYA
jgi:hypothetical protein